MVVARGNSAVRESLDNAGLKRITHGYYAGVNVTKWVPVIKSRSSKDQWLENDGV